MDSLVELAAVGGALAAFFSAVPLALALFGCESTFFASADAAVRVQSFENELGRGGADRGRILGGEVEIGELVHQSMDGFELLQHGRRSGVFVDFERASEV